MFNIQNEVFKRGEIYEGQKNKRLFSVESVGEYGVFYKAENGRIYTPTGCYILFKDMYTGKTAKVSLKTAQRLLLKKIF